MSEDFHYQTLLNPEETSNEAVLANLAEYGEQYEALQENEAAVIVNQEYPDNDTMTNVQDTERTQLVTGGENASTNINRDALPELLSADAPEISDLVDDIAHSENKSTKAWKGPAEALARIKAGDAKSVAYGLRAYKGLTNEVAMELIDAGQGGAVSWYPERFDGLDHDTTIHRLIAAKEAELNRRKQELLDAGFSPYDPRVKELADRRMYRGIMQNLYKFQLKPETLDELERLGHIKAVASYRNGKIPQRGLTSAQLHNRTIAIEYLLES